MKSDYQLNKIAKQLAKWYGLNKRDLPWRADKNPYKIWLSEVILQQTRVDQGMAYFEKFTKKYPTVNHLASDSIDNVLKLWQGLGYYSRARNLHFAANFIKTDLNSCFPATYGEILRLKGVGAYTSAAIASIAFNEPVAVIDGNVYRVLARYFGIKTPIDTSNGKKQFSELAHQILDVKNPGDHNQALMDLGAMVCTPKKPLCSDCPLNDSCYSFSKGNQLDFPVKSKKIKSKNRYFHYYLLVNKKDFYLQKRIGNDIWKGLYELPLFESSSVELKKHDFLKSVIGSIPSVGIKKVVEEKHVLSHQNIFASFYVINIDKVPKLNSLVKVNMRNYKKYAVSRLTERFFETKVFKQALLA